jgi:Fungal Zn(2)-Cys(6) binuclear cluster domain
MSAVGGVGGTVDGSVRTPEGSQQANKPKRVRTGCLTCRERHLKCDEGQPICQNCRKSNRKCKRGVRLNFIDTNVRAPPFMAPTHDWNVTFLDESRDIASEYKGGLSKYGVPEDKPRPAAPLDSGVGFDFSSSLTSAPVPQHQPLPSIQGMLPESYHEETSALAFDSQPQRDTHHHHSHSLTESTYSGSNIPAPSTSTFGHAEQSSTQAPPQGREYMENPEEVLFMQVFVEEVGVWMDSMDAIKHVRLVRSL